MQIHLSPRHLRLTAAIHSHTATKIAHLEELANDIVAAHIVLIFQGRYLCTARAPNCPECPIEDECLQRGVVR